MRQAGRYLPEYRATRARAGGFLAMCTNPEIACEITLQPVDRYPLDAAILFSDILTDSACDESGAGVRGRRGPEIRAAGPIAPPTSTSLGVPDPARELRYVIDAVALVRRELAGRVPLIGFAGSPWTVGTYMVEGGGSKSFGIDQAHDVRGPGRAPSAARAARRGHDSLLECANRGRSAGRHAVRHLGGHADPRAIPRVLPALHGEDRRRTHAGSRRPPRAEHRLHQGRRRVAGRDCGHRLRCRRGRLDHGARRGAARGRGPSGAAGQSRSVRLVRARAYRCAPRPCGCFEASAQGRGTSSIWATASRRTSIPSALRCWSTPFGATPRTEVPGRRELRVRANSVAIARELRARASAQAAAGGGFFNSSRSARRRILPTLVLGSSLPEVHVLRDLVAGQVRRGSTRSAPPR